MCAAAAAPPQIGWTALGHAALWGRLDCLEHLVAKGANVNFTDNVRRRPASRPPGPSAPRRPPSDTTCPPAAAAHPPACVWPAAASPQTKKTALHLAAYVGHAPCVEVLLEAGADASLKDEVSDGTEG